MVANASSGSDSVRIYTDGQGGPGGASMASDGRIVTGADGRPVYVLDPPVYLPQRELVGRAAVVCISPTLPEGLHGQRVLQFASEDEAIQAAQHLAAEHHCDFAVLWPVIRATFATAP